MIIVRHKNMRVLWFMAFLFCFEPFQAINQTCSFIEPCPNHADCNPMNNYCVCEQGYIGNCNIQVDPVGQYPQILQLVTNDTRLLYMKPIEVEQYIEFTLSICRGKDKKNVPVDLYLWTENGSNTEYNFSNTVSAPLRISFDSECNIFITKFVTFGIQPNGESQMLLLGIGNNKQAVTLTLTVSQRLVLNVTFYFYIVVGFIIFVILLAVMSAVMFFVRRRRRFGRQWNVGLLPSQNQHNIDHFQAYMPSVLAVEKPGEKQQCPICLQSIDNEDRIRETPCSHMFHTICLDAWCIQNINCPVCRSDFSIDKIGQIQKVVILNNSKSAKGYQDKWQQSIQMETVEIQVEKPSPIALKQPML